MSIEFSSGDVCPLESGKDGDASSNGAVDGGAGDDDVSNLNSIASSP